MIRDGLWLFILVRAEVDPLNPIFWLAENSIQYTTSIGFYSFIWCARVYPSSSCEVFVCNHPRLSSPSIFSSGIPKTEHLQKEGKNEETFCFRQYKINDNKTEHAKARVEHKTTGATQGLE